MSECLHPIIVDNDDMQASLEMVGEVPLLHCDVHNWNPSVYKQQLELFADTLDQLREKGYPTLYVAIGNEKLGKYAQMFGFKDTPLVTKGSDNITRRIMQCSTD